MILNEIDKEDEDYSTPYLREGSNDEGGGDEDVVIGSEERKEENDGKKKKDIDVMSF